MTFQGSAAMNTGRGRRLIQPSQSREQRKLPQSNMVAMCDGHEVPQRIFDHLKQHGPQKLRGRYQGCAQSVRLAIPKEQWTPIGTWIEAHRSETGNTGQQSDLMMAVLLAHAANRLQQNVGCLFDEIVEKKTAHMLLPNN